MKQKIVVFFIFLFHFSSSNANEIKPLLINQTPLYYYLYNSNQPSTKLLIYLHGSVSVYKGQAESKAVGIDDLVESNTVFVSTFQKHNFNVIAPIAFNEYNWLEPSGMTFLDSLISRYSKLFPDIYICGFSDGATGAYRYFYNNSSTIKGLLLFNGFPQYQNFHKTVDYSQVNSHKIVFVSQYNDNVVPYEFLLTEYRRQKLVNNCTYFKLLEGKHEFVKYSVTDFENCINLLDSNYDSEPFNTDSLWIYPAVDAYMNNGKVVNYYGFRSSIARGFGIKKSEYKLNRTENLKVYQMLKKGNLEILPLKINRKDLQNDNWEFTYLLDKKEGKLLIQNYLKFKAW